MTPYMYTATDTSTANDHSRRIRASPITQMEGPSTYVQWYEDVKALLEQENILAHLPYFSLSSEKQEAPNICTRHSNATNTTSPVLEQKGALSDYTKVQLNAIADYIYSTIDQPMQQILAQSDEPLTISRMLNTVRKTIRSTALSSGIFLYADIKRPRKRTETAQDYLDYFTGRFELLFRIEDPDMYLSFLPEIVLAAHEKNFPNELPEACNYVIRRIGELARNGEPSLEDVLDVLKAGLPEVSSTKRQNLDDEGIPYY